MAVTAGTRSPGEATPCRWSPDGPDVLYREGLEPYRRAVCAGILGFFVYRYVRHRASADDRRPRMAEPPVSSRTDPTVATSRAGMARLSDGSVPMLLGGRFLAGYRGQRRSLPVPARLLPGAYAGRVATNTTVPSAGSAGLPV